MADTLGHDAQVEVVAGWRDGSPVIVLTSGVFGAVLSPENAAKLITALGAMLAESLATKAAEETEDSN